MGYLVLSAVAASVCTGLALAHGASAQAAIETYIISGVSFLVLSLILETYDD